LKIGVARIAAADLLKGQMTMMPLTRRTCLTIAMAAGALILSGCEENLGQGPLLRIESGHVELAATPDRPSVAYFTIKGGPQPVELVAVTADAAQRVEMHETVKGADGLTEMKPLVRVAIPAESTVEFEQGGKHVMIWGVNPAAVKLGKLPMVFIFTNNDRIIFDLPIKPSGAAAGGDHQGH
jgi:copper(I)-binding protein